VCRFSLATCHTEEDTMPFAMIRTVMVSMGLLAALMEPGSAAARQSKQEREAAKQAAKEAERLRKEEEDAPPATVRVPPLPRGQRPTMSVLDFDYQTVVKQGDYDARSLQALASALRSADPNALVHEDNRNIGAGLASLVKAELLKGQSFRLMERQRLDAALDEQDLAAGDRADPRASQVARVRRVQAAQFVLAGAITKFGSDDKTIGGAGIVRGPIGALGLSKKKTIVEITAQVLDASTGEIILSVVGRGVSRKGGGLVVGGVVSGVAGVGGSVNTNIKETAIGEAMQLAAQDLAAKITNMRDEVLDAAEEMWADEVEEERVVAAAPAKPSVAERLRELEELYQQKLLSKAEYEQKRAEILRGM
jgi:curli biogenesis system outer membrane secretion channel CsgG